MADENSPIEEQAETEAPATDAPATDTPATPEAHVLEVGRKSRVGKVVGSKMDKTIVVAVERRVAHRLYGKKVARTKKLYAHDPENVARDGDVVRIEETRPLSKMKRWRVIEVVVQAK